MLFYSMLLKGAAATVYLKEDFSGDCARDRSHPGCRDCRTELPWCFAAAGESRWVVSDWKKDTGEAGSWEVSAGKFFADAEASKGLRTTEDAKFYGARPKPSGSTPRHSDPSRALRVRSHLDEVPVVQQQGQDAHHPVRRQARAEHRLRRRLHEAVPVDC